MATSDSQQEDAHSVNSSNDRLDAMKLSYTEMTVGPSGCIMTRELKLEWRNKLGYCPTCPGRPVLLFNLKRSRLNPLWQSRVPRTVAGECEQGVCLPCQRERQQEQQQQQQHSKRIAWRTTGNPAAANATVTTTTIRSSRQASNSTLGSNTVDYYSRSNSSDSLFRMPQAVSRASQNNNNNFTNERSSLTASSVSTSATRHGTGTHSLSMGSTHHSNRLPSLLLQNSTNNSGSGMNRLARSDRAALLPRTSEHIHQKQQEHQQQEYHQQQQHQHHQQQLDLSALSMCNKQEPYNHSMEHPAADGRHLLPVPTLIAPAASYRSSTTPTPRLAAEHRQFSNTDFSIISSLSNDCSVPSLEEESAAVPATSTHATSTTTAAAATMSSEAETIQEQLRVLLRDLRTNPIMLADILLNAMKSNETLETVQLFCLEAMLLIPVSAVDETGIYRGVFQAMKNHRQSLMVQRASMQILHPWSDDEQVRPILTRHGLCEHIPFVLSVHLGDVMAMQEVMALLRLVTLEEDGRVLCQRHDVHHLVAHAMACHDQEAAIQIDGCAVLSNLSLDVKQSTVIAVPSVILDAVTNALLSQIENFNHSQRNIDWAVIESACFAIKNFLYQQDNQRALARRDELLQGLESLLHSMPRPCKAAATVLEKLQVSRVQDESLQAQVLEALQLLWHKSLAVVLEDMVQIWREHGWSATVLIASLHQLQDMWQQEIVHGTGYNQIDPEQVERLLLATAPLAEHDDLRVRKEISRLRCLLMED